MNKSETKQVFTFTDEEIAKVAIVFISIILFIICITVAIRITPQNCNLFSNNIEGGFACDGVDFTNPRQCPVCEDRQTAAVATIIAGLGFSFLFVLPFIFHLLKKSMNRSIEQTKLFG